MRTAAGRGEQESLEFVLAGPPPDQPDRAGRPPVGSVVQRSPVGPTGRRGQHDGRAAAAVLPDAQAATAGRRRRAGVDPLGRRQPARSGTVRIAAGDAAADPLQGDGGQHRAVRRPDRRGSRTAEFLVRQGKASPSMIKNAEPEGVRPRQLRVLEGQPARVGRRRDDRVHPAVHLGHPVHEAGAGTVDQECPPGIRRLQDHAGQSGRGHPPERDPVSQRDRLVEQTGVAMQQPGRPGDRQRPQLPAVDDRDERVRSVPGCLGHRPGRRHLRVVRDQRPRFDHGRSTGRARDQSSGAVGEQSRIRKAQHPPARRLLDHDPIRTPEPHRCSTPHRATPTMIDKTKPGRPPVEVGPAQAFVAGYDWCGATPSTGDGSTTDTGAGASGSVLV